MNKIEFVNCTPHKIVLNDGREFEPSGNVARIKSSYTEFVNDICKPTYGNVEGLPQPKVGVFYIVSMMVASAPGMSLLRDDLVVPATGHPLAVRKNGQIVSVPGFIKL